MAASLPLAAPAADAPVHATEATQAADAAFRAIYEKEWAWRASEFGFPADEDEKGDADMPRLPDVGPAAQQRRLAVWEDVLAQLETIDPAALSPAEQVNYAVYKIGRAHVCTPVTNAHLVCRLLPDKKNKTTQHTTQQRLLHT